MARDSQTGDYYHPHYRQVSDSVIRELSNRSKAYSRDKISTQREFENSLVFSYSKMAYAKVTGIRDDGKDGIIMGAYPNVEENSKRDGTLTLYNPVSRKPRYPLLQSIEITTSGKLGSVIQANFSFIVFPQIQENGTFILDDIENQFFSPGKEVRIEYGWSTTVNDASNGQMIGIIYNFDWSVNPDLSITGKCSICSPGTLVLGVSGEQPNPQNDVSYDAAGRPITTGDLIGILDEDVKKLEFTSPNIFLGLNGMNAGDTYFIPGNQTSNKKFSYWVIAMPIASTDSTPESQQLIGSKPPIDGAPLGIASPEVLAARSHPSYFMISTQHKTVAFLKESLKDITDVGQRDATAAYLAENPRATRVDNKRQIDYKYQNKTYKLLPVYDEYNITGDRNHPANPNNTWYAQHDADGNTQSIGASFKSLQTTWNEKIEQDRAAGQEGKKYYTSSEDGTLIDQSATGQSPDQAVGQQSRTMEVPNIYYITLGGLIDYLNDLDYPNVDEATKKIAKLFEFQVWGNTTQYLGSVSWKNEGTSIVSCIPEEVFFPDPYMGSYGDFQPFVRLPDAMFNVDGADGEITKRNKDKGLINIGTILISKDMVTEVYKEFLSENQTNIEYKNITAFIDKIIQKINFASGEMYQLTTHIIDEVEKKKLSDRKSIVSIEDTNITNAIITNVKTFKIPVSAQTPIIKSMTVGSKPPPASAHAAFVEARAPKTRIISDVRYTKGAGKDDTDSPQAQEFLTAIRQIEDLKANFKSIGYGPQFTNALKGNYTRVKRNANSNVTKNHWLRRVVYPIELSITLDGIHGFKFGDTITVSYLPKSYVGERGEKFVFTITKISHTIKDYIWETTLNCKARIQAR